jgi:hypothetical protein
MDGPHAVRHALQAYEDRPGFELHLLHVRRPLRRHSARRLARADRLAWHEERALAAMAPARDLLTQQALPWRQHWCVGDAATEIARHAEDLGARRIVFSDRPRGWSEWFMPTLRTVDGVSARSRVPLDVVESITRPHWQRWLTPASLLGFGGLLLLALED